MKKQPKQRPDDFLEMPDLDVLRGILAGDGTISAREQQELKGAVRVLAAMTFEDPALILDVHTGDICAECLRTLEVVADRTTRPVCPACAFWRAMTVLATKENANMSSIRAQGLHYCVVPWGEAVDPVMTARFHSGLTVVSGRLRCQGRIPQQYRESLPDNAVIFEGDPQGKGIGIFHV